MIEGETVAAWVSAGVACVSVGAAAWSGRRQALKAGRDREAASADVVPFVTPGYRCQ